MPPAGLDKYQWALYLSDANLQNSFPRIKEGDPHHLSGSFTLQDKWAEWEKTHPDIIKKAHDLVAAEEGTPPPPATPSSPVPMAQPVNTDELTKAIWKLAEAVTRLAPTKEDLKKDPAVQEIVEEAIEEYKDDHAYDDAGDDA